MTSKQKHERARIAAESGGLVMLALGLWMWSPAAALVIVGGLLFVAGTLGRLKGSD